jgi:gas vesicle protein
MKAMRFLEGFIFGSLLGAALAMLITPSSGEDLRARIQGELDRIRSEVNKAASERRLELEDQLAALRSSRPAGPSAD